MPNSPGVENRAHLGPRTGRTIDLWHGSLEYIDWPALLGLLSDEERRRADLFAFERDARRFVVSHAALRILLSQFIGVPVRELQLWVERGSKPVLQTTRHEKIHFSLSRSEERFLIAFASRPLGADIEWLPRNLDIDALAKQVLSHREREAIECLGRGDRQEAFLRCWTQKEAYLKAIGDGLVVRPDSIEVSVGCGEPPGLTSISGDEHAAARWFVNVVRPQKDYVGAVAIPGDRWRVDMTEFDTCSVLNSRDPE